MALQLCVCVVSALELVQAQVGSTESRLSAAEKALRHAQDDARRANARVAETASQEQLLR
jgi:hypothetical protein